MDTEVLISNGVLASAGWGRLRERVRHPASTSSPLDATSGLAQRDFSCCSFFSSLITYRMRRRKFAWEVGVAGCSGVSGVVCATWFVPLVLVGLELNCTSSVLGSASVP